VLDNKDFAITAVAFGHTGTGTSVDEEIAIYCSVLESSEAKLLISRQLTFKVVARVLVI
jgi:hypothetical protein